MKKLSFMILFLCAFSAHAQWKSVFISGDDSIPNFDNGRVTISEMLESFGLETQHQNHLTSEATLAFDGVRVASLQNIASTFRDLNVDKQNGRCFVFMTSHGIKNQGFYLSQSGLITPDQMATLVDYACGEVPTVILVSACYSGQFIETLAGDNRVILTAAIKDRPSFGCSTDTTYTFWDECVIDSFPVASTWEELYTEVRSCVTDKEIALGFNPSLPQASFGKNMKDLPLFNF